MKDHLDDLSWWLLIPLAVGAGLAPWPAGPEPHLVQKLRWLAAGDLTRPIDIFDLVFHATPTLLAAAKGAVRVWGREDDDGEHADEASEEHAHGHHAKRFTTPEERTDEWNAPERDDWQQPDALIEAMQVDEGMAVADVGTGTGYFVPHLSRAVGDEGQVWAVDLEEPMLEYVDQTVADRSLSNVETRHADQTDTHLPEEEVDRILIVNTWHHIPDRPDYARHLRERLTDTGEVWIVDYDEDSPTGPPDKHRLAPEQVVRELERAGLEAEICPLDLPRQYAVVGRQTSD
jgi:SAM-dependent methyltransferase